MLCCAVLCCAVLCCAVLCSAVPYVICICSEEHNGYQPLPESDEEQGKRPASSQGDLEAWREQVMITTYLPSFSLQ